MHSVSDKGVEMVLYYFILFFKKMLSEIVPNLCSFVLPNSMLMIYVNKQCFSFFIGRL